MLICTYRINIIHFHFVNLRVTDEEVAILSSIETIPHLLLSPRNLAAATIGHYKLNYTNAVRIAILRFLDFMNVCLLISTPAFQTDKEQLVKSMATINGWTGSTYLPIEFLKLAVENRDLESVKKFVKSKSSCMLFYCCSTVFLSY